MRTATIIILGIDPGVADTRFGVIQRKSGQLRALSCGSIRTSSNLPLPKRLKHIHQQLEALITQYRPSIVAVEEIFFHTNTTTAIAVSQARGVVLLAAAQHNLPVTEFTPLQVKVALTSYGRASKAQMQAMVRSVLRLRAIPKPDDAADALAIAICCANSLSHSDAQ